MEAEWTELTAEEGKPGPRSSHAVAVVGRKAYIFGGEHEPRVPIDNLMRSFDLDTRKWAVVEAKGEAPTPRVGVTMAAVGSLVFVFAGRDKDSKELDEFYQFDTSASEWRQLALSGSSPPARSYHAMVADEVNGVLYAFGGCGVDGRLNDLWAFDIGSGLWRELPRPSPESSLVPRGGPGLVAMDGCVWVVFGFCGRELGDIHRFDLSTNTWEQVDILGDVKPSPRSVFGVVPILNRYIVGYGGEVDPSDLGHMGAGNFSDELFVLDTRAKQWAKPVEKSGKGSRPGARGWYASAPVGDDGMLVYGGNSDSNDRLEDLWLLKVHGSSLE